MPPLNRRLDLVRRLPGPLREAALFAALPHAAPLERDALVAELLAGGTGPGDPGRPVSGSAVRDLLRAWGLLSADARGAVLASFGPGAPAALFRELLRSADSRDRSAAINLAVALLLSGAPGAVLGVQGPFGRVGPEVDEALATAAARYDEHRHGALMDAVARVAHAAGPRLREWLADATQPGHMALRAAAKSLPDELARRRAVAWLGVPALRAPARDVLHRTSGLDEWRPLLLCAHLLRAPSRSDAPKASPGTGAGLSDAARHPDALAPAEARGAVRWAAALPMKQVARADLLARWLASPAPLVRFDAARELATGPAGSESDAALVDFSFDESEPVARLAAGALADAQSPSRRASLGGALRRLARSPHATVRGIAREALADRDPLNERDLSGPLACPVAARRALASEPVEFLIVLRRAYAGAPAEARVRLLGLADRLGVLDRLESELLEAVRSSDERLASKAALLLGLIGESAPAREAVERAVEAPVARTRANAVEAFVRLIPDHRRVLEWCRDSDPRVRANAVRHRLIVRREAEGERLLAEMLGDDRPGHRLSALWVAERSRSLTVVNRVADLTRHDDDPRVGARARRCARTLLASMRHGWSTARGVA